ncbi:hypothetical protein [Bradyrhizobium sp. LB8.2]|uniref:hypothetical protein n=1 Tax=Bradyrhizobium sp. LB8.2 TaxID=3156330 RepID=UPI00339133FB
MLATGGSARAGEVVAGVAATCPATGPGFVICGTAGVLLHELVQLANGNEGFGPNGEVMKILAAPVKIVDGNIKAASGESGELDKLIRATTGISVRDINRYGIFGGNNSVFRKPFG